jgi:CDP-diacylglycerol--serine O-phosphatidyltransferase
MADPEQHEIPFQARRIKNPKLRRGIFLLPAAFTSANLLCGYYAIVASLLGTPDDFNRAAKAIGLAILFDSLDGRVARMTGTNTEFGVQFDSLADVVSFVGMPTPAAAGVIAAIVHAFHRSGPLLDWRWSVAWLLMAAALGGLMVSTIRYYSFKDLPWTRKQPAFLILFLILIGAVIWAFSEVVLVSLACTYAVVGVLLHLVRFIRHRMVSRTA